MHDNYSLWCLIYSNFFRFIFSGVRYHHYWAAQNASEKFFDDYSVGDFLREITFTFYFQKEFLNKDCILVLLFGVSESLLYEKSICTWRFKQHLENVHTELYWSLFPLYLIFTECQCLHALKFVLSPHHLFFFVRGIGESWLIFLVGLSNPLSRHCLFSILSLISLHAFVMMQCALPMSHVAFCTEILHWIPFRLPKMSHKTEEHQNFPQPNSRKYHFIVFGDISLVTIIFRLNKIDISVWFEWFVKDFLFVIVVLHFRYSFLMLFCSKPLFRRWIWL